MEITVPWEAFLALIEPVYHKPSSKGGRPPLPLEVMLRIHLLQQWFTLSDPLMEEMLIDSWRPQQWCKSSGTPTPA
jgi:IS5 family transposase